MCACPCVSVHVEVRGYAQYLWFLSTLNIEAGWIQRSLTEIDKLVRAILSSPPEHWDYNELPYPPVFNVDSGDPKSNLHTHAARALFTLSPQPSVSFLSFCFLCPLELSGVLIHHCSTGPKWTYSKYLFTGWIMPDMSLDPANMFSWKKTNKCDVINKWSICEENTAGLECKENDISLWGPMQREWIHFLNLVQIIKTNEITHQRSIILM